MTITKTEITSDQARQIISQQDVVGRVSMDQVKTYANDMASGRWALNGR